MRPSAIPDLLKLLSIVLTILICITVSSYDLAGSQEKPLQESFQGIFSQDQSLALDSDKSGPISASLGFIDKNSGIKYAIYMPFYLRLTFGREYLINGIVVQKHLPEKSKFKDYRSIAQSEWPDISSDDLAYAARTIEAWIKKNPEKPLLLIDSLSRPGHSYIENPQALAVDSQVQESKLTRRAAPIYPELARRGRISGTVVLKVMVDEEGNVEQIRPTSGPPLLRAAAIAAVQQWKYSPTVVDGRPVPVIASVTVIFQLQ
jgi:TonB family protein